MGSFSRANVANTEMPSDWARALPNCACLTFNSCSTSYLESSDSPLLPTFSISSLVLFKPAANVGATASGCWAWKSFIAFSTSELI